MADEEEDCSAGGSELVSGESDEGPEDGSGSPSLDADAVEGDFLHADEGVPLSLFHFTPS